jgi:hypothetical protein
VQTPSQLWRTTPPDAHAIDTPYIARNAQRSIVLVYSVGRVLTHYLGLNGCALTPHRVRTDEFRDAFEVWSGTTPEHFARNYSGLTGSRCMVAVHPVAVKVLAAILAAQVTDLETQLSELEQNMSSEKAPRSPNGPVSQIHAFLDKRMDIIKAQQVSRKELIAQLEAKGFNTSTIVTQCGVWARTNSVNFPRPTQAAAAKKEAAASRRAAKKPS